MSQTPPRLNVGDTSLQPSYAPISWTAVASLAVAILFVTVLAIMGFFAFIRKQPLIEQWILFFPAIAIVLAFVARRQIRASEGTRVGERCANAGWWVAVVGGLAYAAYLGAVEFAIRQDADQEFAKFAESLKQWNPADSKTDEHFYSACLVTVEPGLRTGINPRRPETMEVRFRDHVVSFRQCDIVRICTRNQGKVTFRVNGLKDWQQKPTEITCTLTATLECPEGDFDLVVPMKAVVNDRKARIWQIAPSSEGYVKKKNLTSYGWYIEQLDGTGRLFGNEFLNSLSIPNNTRTAYLGFIQQGIDPNQGGRAIIQNAVLAGGLGMAPPLLDPWIENLNKNIFGKSGGGPMSADEQVRMMSIWNSPGRIQRGGGILRNSPDINPSLTLQDNQIELGMPIELPLGPEGSNMAAARGRVYLRTNPAQDAKLFADIAAAKATPGSKTTERPSAIAQTRVNWRVVRIESDFRPIANTPPAPGGGGPPGMPGG